MLNKKDFLKYASKLAFPIMIQNLIGTLVNVADTVMLGYVSQTAMSASSLANQYTFILFCLYYGMATGTSVLCAQYWGKGDKKTVEKILGLAERISLIVSLVFFVISFSMPTTIMKIFTNSPDTIAAGSEYLKVVSFSFMFMGFSQVFMSALRSVGKIMLPSVTLYRFASMYFVMPPLSLACLDFQSLVLPVLPLVLLLPGSQRY